jgi:cytochrome c-type biogenesis protein CcmH/NrfF
LGYVFAASLHRVAQYLAWGPIPVVVVVAAVVVVREVRRRRRRGETPADPAPDRAENASEG